MSTLTAAIMIVLIIVIIVVWLFLTISYTKKIVFIESLVNVIV